MNLINNLGVVTALGRPGWGASQVEKSPCLNWATQFLTVTYNGACSSNVSVRIAWISFRALPCRKKKLDDSSRLHVVEIARVAWHASFQPPYQEKTCNSAHEQNPLSNDTIDSVLRHREVGRAKDLSERPRKTTREFGNQSRITHRIWENSEGLSRYQSADCTAELLSGSVLSHLRPCYICLLTSLMYWSAGAACDAVQSGTSVTISQRSSRR